MEMHNPPHPGGILKELYLDPLGLSITNAAKSLGVSRKSLSEFINGHSGISSDMALRLGHAFKTSPQLWLRLQQKHDLWHAKQKFNPKGVKVLHGKKSKKAA